MFLIEIINSPYFLYRTDHTVLTAAGCISDITTLRRMLGARLTQLVLFTIILTAYFSNRLFVLGTNTAMGL